MRLLTITVLVSLLLTVRAFALRAAAVLMSGSGIEGQQVSTTVGDATVERSPNVPVTAAKPQPDALGKYHVGDGVTPPRLTHTENPDFSRAPLQKNRRGHRG